MSFNEIIQKGFAEKRNAEEIRRNEEAAEIAELKEELSEKITRLRQMGEWAQKTGQAIEHATGNAIKFPFEFDVEDILSVYHVSLELTNRGWSWKKAPPRSQTPSELVPLDYGKKSHLLSLKGLEVSPLAKAFGGYCAEIGLTAAPMLPDIKPTTQPAPSTTAQDLELDEKIEILGKIAEWASKHQRQLELLPLTVWIDIDDSDQFGLRLRGDDWCHALSFAEDINESFVVSRADHREALAELTLKQLRDELASHCWWLSIQFPAYIFDSDE